MHGAYKIGNYRTAGYGLSCRAGHAGVYADSADGPIGRGLAVGDQVIEEIPDMRIVGFRAQGGHVKQSQGARSCINT